MKKSNVTRRTALSTFSAGSVFGLIANELRAQSTGRMFLALNAQLIQSRVPWPQFAHLAADTGFPGTDVPLKPAMAAGAQSTRDLLSQLHLKPSFIDLPVEFRKDDAAFDAGMAKLEEAAQFAVGIGCFRMMTYIGSSSSTPKDELRATYKKRFTAIAQVLAKSNLRLGLEFLGPLHIRKQFPNEFIWRMPEMLAFAKECGPNVGLTLDAWHWHHAGATVQDILDAGNDRIIVVHFDDAPDLPPEQIRDNQRLMPGEGIINLVGFLQALQKIGYTGPLSVEVFGRGKDMTPEAAAKLGLESSLAVFRKAGVAQG